MKKFLTLSVLGLFIASFGTGAVWAETTSSPAVKTKVQKEGLKDGLKNGTPEGLKYGAKEGQKDGLKYGLKDGLKNGLKDGQINGAKK